MGCVQEGDRGSNMAHKQEARSRMRIWITIDMEVLALSLAYLASMGHVSLHPILKLDVRHFSVQACNVFFSHTSSSHGHFRHNDGSSSSSTCSIDINPATS